MLFLFFGILSLNIGIIWKTINVICINITFECIVPTFGKMVRALCQHQQCKTVWINYHICTRSEFVFFYIMLLLWNVGWASCWFCNNCVTWDGFPFSYVSWQVPCQLYSWDGFSVSYISWDRFPISYIHDMGSLSVIYHETGCLSVIYHEMGSLSVIYHEMGSLSVIYHEMASLSVIFHETGSLSVIYHKAHYVLRRVPCQFNMHQLYIMRYVASLLYITSYVSCEGFSVSYVSRDGPLLRNVWRMALSGLAMAVWGVCSSGLWRTTSHWTLLQYSNHICSRTITRSILHPE